MREQAMPPNAQFANSIVGRNVAAVMAHRRISLDALAESIGMLPDLLQACLRGDARLPVDQLCEASEVLCVSVCAFFLMDDVNDGHVLH
jgi:hypothetical protein